MKTKSRALLALLGLVAGLALVWGASLAVLGNTDTPTARRDAKFINAERLIFYRLEPGKEMRVRVPIEAEELLVVTHELLPDGTPYAPEKQYQYGLQAILRAPEGILLERSIFTRTRQSKGQPQEDGTFLEESAFTTHAHSQVTDEREFVLRLPKERSGHSVLYLRPAGAHGTLLARVYVRAHRTLPLLASQKLAQARAEVRAGRATFEPFEKLSPETRRWLAEEHWERLNAEGEAGTDYQIEPVYRTAFRLPLVEATESVQERLGAGRAVALNVTGPAKPVLWLWSDAADTHPQPHGPVTVQTLSSDGLTHTLELPGPVAGSPMSHPLELPAGVHTVTVRNDGKEDLRYTVEGPFESWLLPAGSRPAPGPAADGHVAFLPDTRRTEAFATGPSCPVLELDLDPRMDTAGRLVRIDARSLDRAPSREPLRLSLTVLDAQGQPLGQAALDAVAEPAPFESADLVPLPGGALPCTPVATTANMTKDAGATGEVTDLPAWVSQVASARLFLPAGARKLRVEAPRTTIVQLYSFLPGTQPLAAVAPYTEAALTGVRWRNAPLDQRSWHPMRPANLDALLQGGARMELLSQVRLEPVGPEADTLRPSGDAVVVRPYGTPPVVEVLEAAEADSTDVVRALSTFLEPGRAVRAQFDARTPTRPEVRLSLRDAAALGNEVEVLLDGEPLHRFTVRSTRSRELLPPLPPGEHEVLLRSSAPGLTAMLNRPPAAGSGLRSRTVYPVGSSGLRVPVRKTGPGTVTLNVVVYTPVAEGSTEPRLSVTIDGGNPVRRASVLVPHVTRAERTVVLPASEREPAMPAGRPGVRWYARTVPVTLGEDIAPGLHTVRIQAVGTQPLWARFFVFGQSLENTAPREWNRGGWQPEDTL
ncbi:hypothetical protein [Corallococcus llansteffanensis]|uniref:Uncharacterized protein n=1 Tax=Corallococcus llansteffanensis TaxID=2316731 RepID=A0A3A8PUX1_9BACT|nr:hypothetical protein [Corallococcus llansteffanensis]RKH60203.1 hypothetical protein D7V93_13685 [Corallococcus llansteffanensis]